LAKSCRHSIHCKKKKSRIRKYPGKAISKYLIPGIVLALKGRRGGQRGGSWGGTRKTLGECLV
jgi:hypothetical protein